MKRRFLGLGLGLMALLAVVGVCLYGAHQEQQAELERQAYIDERTVVAYQVADDGEIQLTFKDEGDTYFQDMYEILDHMDMIYNYDFITSLKDCYEGHSQLVKLQLLDLSIKMQKVEMFGSYE